MNENLLPLLFQRNYLKDTILILVSFLLFTVFLKRENIDLIRENLSLKKRVTRKENYLKITFFKKKETTNKLRGAKCATTKLKNQLKEKIKVVNSIPWKTLAHGKNGANQRTAMFMACIRYLQDACLLSSQKTPIAFHLIFSNSLIIHEEKTKEITTVKQVWICDPNYHKIRRSFALIFSKNYQCFEKLYQTRGRVFHQISKHFEVG